MKILNIFIMLLLLIQVADAEINEKNIINTGKHVGKEMVVNEVLDQTGIPEAIGDSIKESDPEFYNNVQEVCEKTSGARTLLWVLTILSMAGLITFTPAGIVLSIVTGLTYLNYVCII